MMTVKIIVGYFIFINLLAFLLNFIDKRKAIKQKRRISEKTLLRIALIGGSLGAMYAMKKFRHKTVKKSYKNKFRLILFVQVIIIALVVDYYHPYINYTYKKVHKWVKQI